MEKDISRIASELKLTAIQVQKDGIIASLVIKSKKDTEEAQKFKDYFDWSEPIRKTPSHRLLAMRRAENEGIVSLDISPNEELALQILGNQFIKSSRPVAEHDGLAIKDSYKRLLKPSLETEVRLETKVHADREAIKVFCSNLKELLLRCRGEYREQGAAFLRVRTGAPTG